MTAHRAVRDVVVDVLKAAGVAGGRVYANRSRAIATDQGAGVVVRLTHSASELAQIAGGRTSWNTLIEVECYARGAGTAADVALDQIIDAVFDCLDGNPTLNDTVMDVEPLQGETLAWENDELDTSLAYVIAKFVVKHQTMGRTLKV
jgi:hypothetical protein